MNSPLVTFVITTYMRPPEIVLRAVSSALNQTYKNFELIVVDDSPDDYIKRQNVREEIEKIGSVVYIKQPESMGACVARNAGLNIAKGEFIAFLDDDDEWLPEKTEKELSVIGEKDALAYCASKMFDDKNEKMSDVIFHEISGDVYKELLFKNYIGSTSIPLIRTDILRETGGFDPLMQSAQDYDVWLRLAKENTVSFTPEPLVIRHFFGDAQITTNYKKRISGLLRINEKNKATIKKDRKLIWKRNLDVSKYYAADKQKFKAFEIWFKYFWLMPFNVKENLSILKVILINKSKKQ